MRVFILGLLEAEKYANYTSAVAAAGAEPVLGGIEDSEGCDALVLTGGGDVSPSLYGMENAGSMGVDPRRDALETELIRRFTGRPILGICRGAQLLNVALGGSLIQDIPTRAAHLAPGDAVHGVVCRGDSFLSGLYGREFQVNSSHHQAVERLAPGLVTASLAEDGVVEAFYHSTLPIYAVQFHPERMTGLRARPDTVDGGKVFTFFTSL